MPSSRPRSAAASHRAQRQGSRSRGAPVGTPARPEVATVAELTAGQVLEFGEFTFDLERRVLHLRGMPVDLEPRVAALLTYLVARRGRVVSRQELFSVLWPAEEKATDTALNYTASALRRALSACPRPPFQTLRGQGYQFDAATRDATSERDRDCLMGRAAELARLRRIAASCVTERTSRVVLLTGSAGIGKSRLGQELGAEWLAGGHQRLIGRCTEAEDAPPLWPWRAVLEELKAAPPPRGRANTAPSQPPQLDLPVSRADRWAYFEALREGLKRLARTRPLLIALEDVHLADDASLALLQFLAVDPQPCPILLLASYRVPLSAVLEPYFRDLVRHAEVISLGPLEEAASRRLLRSCLAARCEAQLERDALASAGGVPLFIKEVAFGLGDQPARVLHDLPVARLPGTHAAIDWHLGAIDQTALQVLQAAAVAGEEFDARLVAAALGRPARALLPALDVAAKLEIIRPCSELSYRFVHSLFWRHVYAALTEVQRRQLHYRIGTCLVESGRHHSDFGLSQAAHHLAEGAVTASEATLAAEVSRASADSLVARFAFETAAREYRRALRLTVTAGGGGEERIGLMIRAADCLRVGGRHAEAQQLAGEAVQLARALQHHVCLGEATCALVDVESILPNSVSPHLPLLREALQLLPASEARLRARVLAHLILGMHYSSSVDERASLCAEALQLSMDQDAKTRSLVLFARNLSHWGLLSHKREWEGWVEQSIQTARAANDPQRELHGLCLQLAAALETGRLNLAEGTAQLLEERGKAIGSLFCCYIARAFRACLAVFRGRADAEALCRSAYELGSPHLPAVAEHSIQAQLLMLALETGAARHVLPAFVAVGEAPDALPLYAAGVGLVYSLIGDAAGARPSYERSRAAGFRLPDDGTALAVLTVHAEVCAYQQDHESAGALYERLAPFGDRLAVTGAAIAIPAVPGYGLARLALVLGRPEAAREHLTATQQLCERLGSPLWVQRCALGLELIETGAPLTSWAPRALAP